MFGINYKTTLISLFTFLHFLFLNIYAPPQGDDWNYILSNRDSITNTIDVFLNWNSRLGELLFSSNLSQIPQNLFDFFNAIVACIFLFLFFYILFLRFPNNLFDFAVVSLILLLLLLLLSFEEVFLWGSGSLNYLWGFSLSLLFLIPYRKMLQNIKLGGGSSKNSNIKNISFCILMLMFGFVIGMWHESTSSLLLLILFLYLIVLKFMIKRSIPLWFYLGLAGLFIGFCVLFFSPGQNSRIFAESIKYDYISIGDFLSLGLFGIISRLNVVLTNALNQNPIFFPIFSFIIAFIYAFWYQIKNQIFRFLILLVSIILFLLILIELPVFAYLMIFAMFIYVYAKSKDGRFLVCAILLFCYFLSILSTFQLLNLPFRSRSLCVILLIAIIVILSTNYLANKKIQYIIFAISVSYFCYVYYCYYDLNSKWNNLVNLVSDAKDAYKGKQELLYGKIMKTYNVQYLGYGIDIVVPKEQYSFTYRGFTPWWNLSEDTKNDINQSYAFIFKVRSIALK
ncbi:MAG: hypothetical protein IKC84_03705 [Helicobacteraceae bacterium]|nr:hypothetical protein [Helicobacteraceae bacterium]